MKKCPVCGYEMPPSDYADSHRRNQAMAERYAQGDTYQAIADDFGISKGRVRQLVMRVKRDEMLREALERGYGAGDCTMHAASRALRRYRSDVE